MPLAGREDLQQGDLEGEQRSGDQKKCDLLVNAQPLRHSLVRVNGTKRTGIRLVEYGLPSRFCTSIRVCT